MHHIEKDKRPVCTGVPRRPVPSLHLRSLLGQSVPVLPGVDSTIRRRMLRSGRSVKCTREMRCQGCGGLESTLSFVETFNVLKSGLDEPCRSEQDGSTEEDTDDVHCHFGSHRCKVEAHYADTDTRERKEGMEDDSSGGESCGLVDIVGSLHPELVILQLLIRIGPAWIHLLHSLQY
ncbi:hypothetical protein BD324DRAFT_638178 [Kockovaella imperatae]|uniref:Uncharacterized protein n=1 Tax=Kockovaella imperatae TaxID=4999 RepID=A0A1Y1U7Q9_9TREE|nr:hypothetical protein BD324DRAFT_638178 [Kockovaella imperatae]ORX34048.1 hypothetical protein BD324DRAFT_638178 [Kockovaella imperatae]